MPALVRRSLSRCSPKCVHDFFGRGIVPYCHPPLLRVILSGCRLLRFAKLTESLVDRCRRVVYQHQKTDRRNDTIGAPRPHFACVTPEANRLRVIEKRPLPSRSVPTYVCHAFQLVPQLTVGAVLGLPQMGNLHLPVRRGRGPAARTVSCRCPPPEDEESH